MITLNGVLNMVYNMQYDHISVPCQAVFCSSCGHFTGEVSIIPKDIKCPKCNKNNHYDYECRI